MLLYLDTSAVLRAVLEEGTDSELEGKIGTAELLLTSRLSLVECARAFHRLRHGDEIRIEGIPDGGEPAAIDYIEIVPAEHR